MLKNTVGKNKKRTERHLQSKIFIFLIFTLIQISFISALDFDDWKTYDKETKTFKIENAFTLGDTLLEGTLNTPLDNRVGLGYQKVAEFEVISSKDYEKIIKGFELQDVKNKNKVIERQIDIKYLTTEQVEFPDYKKVCSFNKINNSESCSYEIVGSHFEERESWKEFDGKIKKDEKVIIGLWTDVQKGDKVEWIPTISAGRDYEIKEWAVWTADLNTDIQGYWKMDETSGTIAYDSLTNYDSILTSMSWNSSGLLEGSGVTSSTGIHMNTTYSQGGGHLTLNYWIKATNEGSAGNTVSCFRGSYPCGTTPTSNGHLQLYWGGSGTFHADYYTGTVRTQAFSPSGYINDNWTMVSLIINESVTVFVNGVSGTPNTAPGFLIDANSDIIPLQLSAITGQIQIDEVSIWNRTLTQAEITNLYNSGVGISYDYFRTSITLNSPVNYFNTTSQSVTFNCSATDNNGVLNLTLIIDDVDNYTIYNESAGQNLSLEISRALNEGIHNWTCEGYDNEDNLGTTATRYLNISTIPTITINLPANNTNYSTSVLFNATSNLNIDTWLINWNGTNYSVTDQSGLNLNKSLLIEDGTFNLTIYGNNSNAGQLGFTSGITFSVDKTLPLVNITYPYGNINYHTTRTNLTINWTVSDTNLGSCWWSMNDGGTNTSVVCLNNNISINVTSTAQNNFTLWVNDTFGNSNYNKSIWDYLVFENSQTYNSTTYETASEGFVINLTYDNGEYSSIIANLIYNSSSYSGTKTGTGGTVLFSRELNIPSLSSPENKPFYWSIGLYNGTWNYVNTTVINQTINTLTSMSVVSGSCPTGLNKVMNFTFSDEINSTSLASVAVEYNLKYGLYNSTGSSSYGNTTTTELSFCLNTSQASEYTIGEGEIHYSLNSYSSRRYYIFGGTKVSNQTTYNKLYLLPTTESTSFLIEIREPTLTPYVDKYTSLMRWYPSLDEYKVVEMGKTDDKGQTVNKVKTEDVDYRVGVYEKNGTLIYLANPIRMVCLASPCTYTLKVNEETSYKFDAIQNIQSSLTYSAGVFTFVYNDPSQNTENMKLDVYKIGGTASETILCSDNSSSFTGILTCDVSSESGILKATAYRTASPIYAIATKIVDTTTTIFQGTFGLFIQFIISAVIITLGLFSPVLAIILGVVSLLPGVLLFKTVTYPIFIGFAILGGIIIHFLKGDSR